MVRDDWPEETLYQGILNRDRASLAELIRLCSLEMASFIRSVLENCGTAQDVRECVRDLFIAVWQEIGAYDPARGSLHTWVTMRAKYIALARRRQILRRRRMGM